MTHEYEMTLKFKLSSQRPIDPNFADALSGIFRDYEDGRYPFTVEQVQNGLSDCMKGAAREAVEKALQEKFGEEMVPSPNGNGHFARWYLESLGASPVVPHVCDPPTVSIS